MKGFLIPLLLVFASPLMAQDRLTNGLPRGAITYSEMRDFLGISFCMDGKGYTFILDGLSPTEAADVRAHEAKHREQYRRYPNCAAASRWLNTPRGAMESEAEAYMAGLCVSVAAGLDKLTLMQNYAGRIERLLGSEINRVEIIQAMQKYDHC